jgi:sugar lactone lactonase YvrE
VGASPEGGPILRIRLPEVSANVCFGGAKSNRLFMAAGHWLYSLYVQTRGARVWRSAPRLRAPRIRHSKNA